jgi:DNA-binding HxlR family transcriptional regulator
MPALSPRCYVFRVSSAGGTAIPVDHVQCERGDVALTRAFEFLGRRWNAAVLGALQSAPAGFRELSRSIPGISDSVLSNRLSNLTSANLLVRTVDEGPPVSVTYSLTDAGHALMPALKQISRWATEHLPE